MTDEIYEQHNSRARLIMQLFMPNENVTDTERLQMALALIRKAGELLADEFADTWINNSATSVSVRLSDADLEIAAAIRYAEREAKS